MSRPSPEIPYQSPEDFTVAVVDQSADIHSFARDEAMREYTEMMNEGGGKVRQVVRNIWKGNIFREYYIQKFTARAEQAIKDEGSLYAHADENAKQAATESTLSRFVSEYDEHIHEEAGESRRWLDASNGENETKVINDIKDIVSRFTNGEITEEQLREERTNLIDRLAENQDTADLVPKSAVYADNIETVARNVRAAVEHGASLEEALARVRVVAGEGRAGVRTEARYSRIDKIIDRVNQSQIGTLVGRPVAVASAVSIAASLAGKGSEKVAYVAGGVVAPGVVSGALAGIKENKRIKDERQQHSRERAQGSQMPESEPQSEPTGNRLRDMLRRKQAGNQASRREGLEASRYDTVSAREMAQSLGVALRAGELRTDLSQDESVALFGALSEAIGRTSLSDRTKNDFISYEGRDLVESQRFELDLRIAQAKVALRRSIEAAENSAALQSALGIDEGADFDMALQRSVDQFNTTLLQDVVEKDAAFADLKRKEIAKAATKAAAMGATIGMLFQEGIALIDDSRAGLIESGLGIDQPDSPRNETFLKSLFSENEHTVTTEGIEAITANSVELPGGGHIELPEGYILESTGENTFQLLDAEGGVIAPVDFTTEGVMTDESLNTLYEHGVRIGHATEVVTSYSEITSMVELPEFLSENETHRISRDLWYDNNTPAPVFDLNELGLWWGGENNVGADVNGNFHMTISHMTADGSFHGAETAAWQQEAAAGRLQLAISVSQETQDQVFFVPIDASGNAVIEANSPVAQLFTQDPDGSAVFNGHYVEVVELTGVNTDGTQGVNILATHIGENNIPQLTATELVPEERLINDYVFSIEPTETVTNDFIEVPPFIPIYGRKPLEQLLEVEPALPPYYHRGELSPEEIDRRRQHFSPRLRENPEAKLDEAEEISWYLDQQSPEQRQRLRHNAEQAGEMGGDVEIVATIPVAGHQEAENIYRTLEAYTDQTMDRNKFEIVLYVNNPEIDEAGQSLNSDATLAEINRFMNDYPDMPVKVMHESLPRSEAKIGKIRKTLVDSVLARHKDRLDAGSDAQLIIVSNDADAIRINPEYLQTMLSKLQNNRDLEAVVGQVDWDNKAYVNYPEVHVGTRLFQFIDILLRHKENLIGATSGANTAFRASMYAAVGGYDSDYDIVEDVRLGRDFRIARFERGVEPVGFGGTRTSRIETSARRSVWALLTHGDAPYNQWNHGFSADDDSVRSINVDTLEPRDFKDPRERTRLLQGIEQIINKTLFSIAPSTSLPSSSVSSGGEIDEGAAEYIARSLRLLGIEFKWNGSYKSITITDGEKLLDGLAEYADRIQRQIARRRGAAVLHITREVDEDSGAVRFRDSKGRFVSHELARHHGLAT